MARGRFLWATALTLAGAVGATAQTDITRLLAPPTADPLAPTRPLAPAPTAEPEDPRPESPYDLKAEAGAWLVAVKSFKGEREIYRQGRCVPDARARELAEQLATYIRKEYKIYAYVYPHGWEQRQVRDKEAAESRERKRLYWVGQNVQPDAKMLSVKTVSIPDEYTVFVAPARGPLKDRETAIDFANQVRKLKAPDEFNDRLLQGSDKENSRTEGSSFNAFLASMAGMNPVAKKAALAAADKNAALAEAPKAEKYLMEMNSAESYSLLHKTRKKWTVLVQTYGGGGTIIQTGAADGGQTTDRLERAAQQAHNVAEILRKQHDPKFDAYVMHTRYHSMVFVGDYADRDDPQLLATVKTFASMQLKEKLASGATGKVLETFMEKPAPVMILKPER